MFALLFFRLISNLTSLDLFKIITLRNTNNFFGENKGFEERIKFIYPKNVRGTGIHGGNWPGPELP